MSKGDERRMVLAAIGSLMVAAVGCGASDAPSSRSDRPAAARSDSDSPPTSGAAAEPAGEPASVEEIPVNVLPAKAVTLEEAIRGESEAAEQLTASLRTHGELIFVPTPEASAAIEGGLRLTLFADATARVDYLGDQPGTSSGSFRVDTADRLRLDFGSDDPWLPMPITSAGEGLRIEAPETEAVVQAAIDAGIPEDEITDTDLEAAFALWPLRWKPGAGEE